MPRMLLVEEVFAKKAHVLFACDSAPLPTLVLTVVPFVSVIGMDKGQVGVQPAKYKNAAAATDRLNENVQVRFTQRIPQSPD